MFLVFSTDTRKERGDLMVNIDKNPDLVEQPLMSTGTTEPGFERNTKNAKLASKPKIGETIIGEDGITGRMR